MLKIHLGLFRSLVFFIIIMSSQNFDYLYFHSALCRIVFMKKGSLKPSEPSDVPSGLQRLPELFYLFSHSDYSVALCTQQLFPVFSCWIRGTFTLLVLRFYMNQGSEKGSVVQIIKPTDSQMRLTGFDDCLNELIVFSCSKCIFHFVLRSQRFFQ